MKSWGWTLHDDISVLLPGGYLLVPPIQAQDWRVLLLSEVFRQCLHNGRLPPTSLWEEHGEAPQPQHGQGHLPAWKSHAAWLPDNSLQSISSPARPPHPSPSGFYSRSSGHSGLGRKTVFLKNYSPHFRQQEPWVSETQGQSPQPSLPCCHRGVWTQSLLSHSCIPV